MANTNTVYQNKGLFNNYCELFNTDLIKNRIATEEACKQFASVLNRSVPETDKEKHTKNAILSMYVSNPQNFYKYCMDKTNKSRHFILYTNGQEIARSLGLIGICFINWDKKENQFVVKPNTNPKKQEETVKSNEDNEEPLPTN